MRELIIDILQPQDDHEARTHHCNTLMAFVSLTHDIPGLPKRSCFNGLNDTERNSKGVMCDIQWPSASTYTCISNFLTKMHV